MVSLFLGPKVVLFNEIIGGDFNVLYIFYPADNRVNWDSTTVRKNAWVHLHTFNMQITEQQKPVLASYT